MFTLDIELLKVFHRLSEIEIVHSSLRCVSMCVQCVTEPRVSLEHGTLPLRAQSSSYQKLVNIRSCVRAD